MKNRKVRNLIILIFLLTIAVIAAAYFVIHKIADSHLEEAREAAEEAAQKQAEEEADEQARLDKIAEEFIIIHVSLNYAHIMYPIIIV